MANRAVAEDRATLVGIDHGFSFPLRYFEVHRLKPDWATFLDDFQQHWPTDQDHTYVDFVREGIVGNGNRRVTLPPGAQETLQMSAFVYKRRSPLSIPRASVLPKSGSTAAARYEARPHPLRCISQDQLARPTSQLRRCSQRLRAQRRCLLRAGQVVRRARCGTSGGQSPNNSTNDGT